MSAPLRGRRILVTRPAGQADGLIRRLEAAGALVLHRPTLAIVPCQPDSRVNGQCPDWIVFISPNAVDYGLAHLPLARCHSTKLAAVGPGTAARLRHAGLPVTVAPVAGGGADALLAEPAFDPGPGETVVIVRGKEGRRRLQSALLTRDVELREMAVYERIKPDNTLAIPQEWQARRLDCTIVTSQTGLAHLLGMAEPCAIEWVRQGRLVTVSDRIAQAATAAGFDRPLVADGADDDAITRTVCAALQRENQ